MVEMMRQSWNQLQDAIFEWHGILASCYEGLGFDLATA